MTNKNKALELDPKAAEGVSQFPNRLKDVVRGESLRSFSKKCGFSEGVLRSYLRGDTYPNLDRFVVIARVGGVSVEWLATGEIQDGQKTDESSSAERLDDEFLIKIALVTDSLLRERKVELGSIVHRLRIYSFLYTYCLPSKKIDAKMTQKIISLFAPRAFLLDEDQVVCELIDKLAISEAKNDIEKVQLRDEWWDRLAEKFDAPGFMIPIADKDKVISWLNQELQKRDTGGWQGNLSETKGPGRF
ncbi:MAG: helix-turn-helix transcriptional regulator [Desulfuromonadales bacterium]|nr:helix-turn-helix transcriptional regulator [Desulfuromonadales bacterium]